jgi:hypothetical protein
VWPRISNNFGGGQQTFGGGPVKGSIGESGGVRPSL